jgi:hypothetical protein
VEIGVCPSRDKIIKGASEIVGDFTDQDRDSQTPMCFRAERNLADLISRRERRIHIMLDDEIIELSRPTSSNRPPSVRGQTIIPKPRYFSIPSVRL